MHIGRTVDRLAEWTKAVAIWTWAHVGVGTVTVAILALQSCILKQQASIMERQTELSEAVERPWIAIDGISVIAPLTFKDQHAILTVKFQLHNTGHVPAAHVLAKGIFIVRSPAPVEMGHVWEQCDLFRAMPLDQRGTGVTIFPDQSPPLNYAAQMEPDDFKRLSTIPVNGTAVFAGCIDYTFARQDERHQTRFVYEVDKKGPNGSVLIISPADGDIPIENVILNINPLLAGNPD